MPSSKLTFPLWSASGTDPSQAAKQSPNQLLKPSHAHQCPIGSDYPANPPGKEEKGGRKKKKKIELVYKLKAMRTYLYTYPTFFPSSKAV